MHRQSSLDLPVDIPIRPLMVGTSEAAAIVRRSESGIAADIEHGRLAVIDIPKRVRRIAIADLASIQGAFDPADAFPAQLRRELRGRTRLAVAREVATLLGCSEFHIRKLQQWGEIPSFREAGLSWIRVEDFIGWIESLRKPNRWEGKPEGGAA